MSTMELNKMVAAVLVATLVAMTAGLLTRFIVGGEEAYHGEERQYAYLPDAVANADEGDATEVVEEEGEPPIGPLIAAASVEDGKTVAKKCAACHSFDAGGANKVGPNLYNIVGGDIGGKDFRYSDTLTTKEGVWGHEELSAFLKRPAAWAPGTNMSFAGLRKQEDRAALIAYMRSLTDNPPPLE